MRVLAVITDYIPSSIINVVAPLKYMDQQGMIAANICPEAHVTPQDVAQAEVMVLCRNIDPAYRPIYELALKLEIPIIYDLDDYFVAAPPSNKLHAYMTRPSRLDQYEWIMRHSTLVRVHSPIVAQHVRQYNENVRLVWAAVDWSLVPDTLPPLPDDAVHIIYSAQTETGRQMYPLLEADLSTLLSRYGDRVHLHFLGYTPPELCKEKQVTCHPFETDYEAFFRAFTRFGYAIGLAPMLHDDFHQGKTNLKYRDYAAAGAAGIYTDCPLYRNGVVDGETGLLISGEPGSWLVAIERLLENPSLLEHIRRSARRHAEETYSMETVTSTWMACFAQMPKPPPISQENRTEIQAISWWFTGRHRSRNAIGIRQMRAILRRVLPTRLKLFYYDTVTNVRGRLLRRF